MDIICGAPGEDQNRNLGAVYMLFRNPAAEITEVQKLSPLEGFFNGFF